MATAHQRLASTDRLLACAICERTILIGEEPLRFSDRGQSRTVCRLCAASARQDGWVEAGRSAPPPTRPQRQPSRLSRILMRSQTPPELDPADPVRAPHGLGTADDLARATTMLIGVETFNASPYRGTVSAIAKSLGQAKVSVVAFGGRRPGAAITIVWDLSWYRYLVEPGGIPTVRLDERGDSLAELAPRWRDWNARACADGSIELDIKPPTRGPSFPTP
ncbi:MAG: hypothetical protein EXQ67_00540 [Thermoleophilia bacterium]|nr:hypothetical protein [Thermoleophilia bacterium]